MHCNGNVKCHGNIFMCYRRPLRYLSTYLSTTESFVFFSLSGMSAVSNIKKEEKFEYKARVHACHGRIAAGKIPLLQTR